MGVLLQNVRPYDLEHKTLCQLFDAFVASILNYSFEVWGNTKSKHLERIHLKYCKKVLNVEYITSNAGVYGELWRYSIYINRPNRVIKHWFKLIYTDNCVLQTAYAVSLKDLLKANTIGHIM